MQAVGLHSALAIRRERKRRREQQTARDRRYSSQIDGSFTPRGSITSTDGRTRLDGKRNKSILGTKVMGNITMLHIGVVFTMLGLFFIVSSLIPGYMNPTDWEDMFGIGIFFFLCGIFLVFINRMITKKEDELLLEDVQNKLSRSRSGHRIVRDVESGALSPAKETKPHEDSLKPDTNYYDAINSPVPNGDAHLDKIVEECEPEPTENGKVHGRVDDSQESTSLSPSSPSETKGLLHSKNTSRV